MRTRSNYLTTRSNVVSTMLVVLALCLGLAAPAAGAAREVLVVDLVNEPSTLDPHVQWNSDSYYVYRNVFDNMVTRDDTGRIAPQIATAWRRVSDTVVEFDLRTDVTFHDGSPLTAEDVVFSVKRVTDPAFKSPQLGQFNKIVGAEAIGRHKVRLTTEGPYPVLLAQLVKLSIVPKAYVTRLGNERFNLEPMGSGPYKFVAWQRGVKVTLARNDAYWGGKGPFPTVEFHAVPDVATRLANLRSGKSDLIVTINPDQAAELKADSRVKVLSVLTERVAYLRLNTLHGPTKDIRVRKAIAHAIDRQGIIDGLLGGYDKQINVMLTPLHVGYAEGFKGNPYDPARARQLLAEAGPAAKGELRFATSPVYDQRVVQAIQQMLTEVGLKVNISLMDHPTYLKQFQGPAEGSGALGFGRWSCACQDADGVLFPLLHSSSIWAKYSRPEMDRALEAARSSVDEKVRLTHYRAVHAMVEEDVPLIAAYQVAGLYGARKELRWRPTPDESLFIMRMQWGD